MPAKPAWGKSFVYGGFKSHLMHLWDAFLGHNTTAVVICAGAKTLRFSVALVECMAPKHAGNDILKGNADGTADEMRALKEVSHT